MSVFSVNCQFADEAQSLTDATNGWDVVYAVKYSYLNDSIFRDSPWLAIDQYDGPGSVFYSNTDEESVGLITGLRIANGGSGSALRFELALGVLHRDTHVMGALVTQIATDIRAEITVTPSFARGAEDGLMALTVSLPTDPTVSNLSAANSTIPMADLIACVEDLLKMSEIRDLFTMELAHVLTRDLAESGHIPWLQPKEFRFATADLPGGTDGILAILGSISGDMTGLAAEVNPLAIPVDEDIGAAIIVHSRTLSTQTFCEQLNSQLGPEALGSLTYAAGTGTLANASAISAYYQQDEDGHFALLLPENLADAPSAAIYPATIPAGAMRMTVASNSIDVSLSPVRVTMSSYTLVINMSSSFQIVADEDDNFNLLMIGEPSVSYTVDGQAPVTPSFIAASAAVVGGILAGELVPVLVNKTFLRMAGPKTERQLNRAAASVIPAERYLEIHGNDAVGIKVSFRSEVIVSATEQVPAHVRMMTNDEIAHLRLPREMPEFHAVAPKGNKIRRPNPPLELGTGDVHKLWQAVNKRPVAPNGATKVGIEGSADATKGSKPINVEMKDLSSKNRRDLDDSRAELVERTAHSGGQPFGKGPSSTKALPWQAPGSSPLTLLLDEVLTQVGAGRARQSFVAAIKGKSKGFLTASEIGELTGEAVQTADIYAMTNRLSLQNQKDLYNSIVECIEESVESGLINQQQYANIIIKCRSLLNSPENDKFIENEVKLFLRVDGKVVKIDRNKLYNLNALKSKPKFELMNRSELRTFIGAIDRSIYTKCVGVGLYVGGAILAYYAGNFFNDRLQKIATTPADTTRGLTDNLANKGNLLFRSVSFPLLTRASDSGPAPTATLRCAAINGGLVLGIGVQYVA